MKRSNHKLRFLYILMSAIALAVIVNVFLVTIGKIHIRSGTSLSNYIQSVSNVEERIFASRGNIYDNSGAVVAQDVKTYDIICYLDKDRLSSSDEVAYVDNPLFTAQALSPILGIEPADIYDILTSNPDLYQVELGAAGRNLSEDQKNQIEAIEGLHGIDFRNSYKRYYPYGETFSPQLVGFAQSDNTGKLIGKLGIENYLNDELSGTDGYHSYQRDKYGYILPGMYEETVDAINGYDVYLTLDISIQEALNTALNTTMEAKNASRAWAAVVEIKTGKILAWGQTPSYDPNNLSADDVQVNYGSQLAYEPGSVMKAVIYSAAMDLGVYDGDTLFDSSPYCYTASTGRTYAGNQLGCIYNVSRLDWGNIPLDYGLIYSSNVATATLLSQYVGISNFEEYLNRYHLYQNVNSDGIDEVPGYTNYGLSPVDDITATYGQGSSTTMLQLLQAYTAIFGNGEMIKPYMIEKIVDPNSNTVVYQGSRKVVSTPISKSSARQMQDLLRRVVAEPDGTCRHYAAKTVEVMGKTGTSEIPLDGGYAEDQNIISCMLGFPYEDPEYMVYFAYVSPETVYFNYDIKPIPDLIDRIALLENLTISEDEMSSGKYIEKYEMPSLLSQSMTDARRILEGYDLDVIEISDGSHVIKQYPKAGDDVYSYQKVFLLSDGNSQTLPDFTGWTRKDVIDYWNLSGLSIRMEGFGVAYEQSIAAGSSIDPSTEITIRFREINYVEKEEVQAEEIDPELGQTED
ncbi:MAG: penicillin-binding protein [Erysipelotrichaceae bacterium]|nr:penicillin-binding protein [Erysipelotrichaceae bacterium]